MKIMVKIVDNNLYICKPSIDEEVVKEWFDMEIKREENNSSERIGGHFSTDPIAHFKREDGQTVSFYVVDQSMMV